MFSTLSSEALEQGDLALFPPSETFSVLLWGWAKDTPTTLQSNTWLWADHVKQNSVWAQPTSNWKAFSSRKALKSIQKYPEPYSLVWQHQEKKFQREYLLLDKYRRGTGPEFLNNSETQSFLLRYCFLLCTILKQRVFSSTSRNYCSWLKLLPAQVAQGSSGIYFLEVTVLRYISAFHLPLLVVLASTWKIAWTHLASILLQLDLEKRTPE